MTSCFCACKVLQVLEERVGRVPAWHCDGSAIWSASVVGWVRCHQTKSACACQGRIKSCQQRHAVERGRATGPSKHVMTWRRRFQSHLQSSAKPTSAAWQENIVSSSASDRLGQDNEGIEERYTWCCAPMLQGNTQPHACGSCNTLY